jgi:UDP-glucose 4-epimerase
MPSQTLAGEKFLITGGLGYIGAHVAREFIASECEVYILDNLSTGLIGRLPLQTKFIECDVRNAERVREICNTFEITGVVHMAAFKHARESKLKSPEYLANNVGGTLGLVEGIKNTGVKKLIFSSSCSVYGNAEDVNEDTQPSPQSPYALSKLISEQILQETVNTLEVNYSALRFFNVVGCADFSNSQDTSSECLIPVVAERIKNKKPIHIFGDQLPTPDGTCLRDYLDVRDIARAHTIVADEMSRREMPKIINLSSGKPTSVGEIIRIFEDLLGRKLEVTKQENNPADPVAVWSQKSKFLTELGWSPQYSLEESIFSHLKRSYIVTNNLAKLKAGKILNF